MYNFTFARRSEVSFLILYFFFLYQVFTFSWFLGSRCLSVSLPPSASVCLFLFSRVHATLHPALSVRRSVRLSVSPSHFTFLGFLRSLASLLLPKSCIDLNYGPCPPARDWGSRVSGLVCLKMTLV